MKKKPTSPPRNRPGRPPIVCTRALAKKIGDKIADGQSLRAICKEPGMPSRDTVMRWQLQNPEFAAICARAREWQADLMDDMIFSAAIQCKPETANADRVKIEAFKWRAGRLAPKRYGDKVALEHAGKDGGPISFSSMTDDQLADLLARVQK